MLRVFLVASLQTRLNLHICARFVPPGAPYVISVRAERERAYTVLLRADCESRAQRIVFLSLRPLFLAPTRHFISFGADTGVGGFVFFLTMRIDWFWSGECV